jgi:hypothetical protein
MREILAYLWEEGVVSVPPVFTPNLAAISSSSPLAFHAFSTRSRKSIEYGAAIVTSAEEEYHDRRTTYKSKPL